MIDTRHCFRLRIYETSASIAEYASTAKCDAKARYTGNVLKCRVWWLRKDGMGHTGVDGGRVGGRDLRGGYSSNPHINLPKTSYCVSQKVYMGYG